MTDHASLRAALASGAEFDDMTIITVRKGDLRALLADYDRLREALWVLAEHNALHFGESHNTVIVARAALAQKQGESDGKA